MRAVVIGGRGHIGTYLIPRLIEAGYEVINVSRGTHAPYQMHGAWQHVKQVNLDRKAEEASGNFGNRIAELHPDIVIDLICFTLESAQQLAEPLKGKVQHFLHCGSAWIHGPSVQVPVKEEESPNPFGEYGIQKKRIEEYLLRESRLGNIPATVIHPGHIVGPGWCPINPAGNLDPQVFVRLAKGEEVLLPNLGMETLHHVHADDVAQAFMKSLAHWSSAVGQSFHAVSDAAVTLRGYAQVVAGWFGKEAVLRFLPFDEWKKTVTEEDAALTMDHILHSPNCSIEKGRRLIGYQPRYTSLEAIREAVDWMIGHGVITI